MISIYCGMMAVTNALWTATIPYCTTFYTLNIKIDFITRNPKRI